VPSQQPKGQLQTQHSVETGNYSIDKHNIKRQRQITGKHRWKKIIIIVIIIIIIIIIINYINSVKIFSLRVKK
jgi:t-SNARE complex subunit (syntaxin)